VRFILKSFAWILLAAVATAVGIAIYVWQAFYAPGPVARSGNETVVLLEPGLGLAQIAGKLESAGVVRDKNFFRVGAFASGKAKDLKAGEYAIPSKASMDQVMAILVEGKSIMHKLTVPEGLTSAMIVKLLADDAVLIENPPAVPNEGTLMPETYLFLRGTTRQQLLARMEKSHQEALDDLWANRKSGLPFKTKAEAVILASIVEKETGVPEERPRVAAVFLNRLRKGMRLQSDPTIIYGLTKGVPLGRGIRQSELEKDTGYNTYIIDGLPPTPIANPGLAALKAVLNPPDTKELYFVADGTGGHVFAETIEQHNDNVAKWRKLERNGTN
jgi:UPF0755 protein